MNAGKLVAEIAVLAIVAYCCYGAVAAAIPQDVTALGEPVSGMDHVQIETSQDGLNVNVTIKGELTNNLPQDLDDVEVTVYLGSGSEKLKLAGVTKTLTAGKAVPLDESMTIPVYAVMACTANIEDKDGKLTLPLSTKIAFKYFDWQDTHLVDMGMTVRTDLPIDGIGRPEITYPDSGDKTKVQVEMKTDSGIIRDVISALPSEYKNKNIELESGDARISFYTDGSEIVFTVAGDGTDDAAKILGKNLGTAGKLTFTYDGKDYGLEKEQSEALIKIIDGMYGEVRA